MRANADLYLGVYRGGCRRIELERGATKKNKKDRSLPENVGDQGKESGMTVQIV